MFLISPRDLPDKNMIPRVKGHMQAGTTRVHVEDTIADAANIFGIDKQLRIEGQTLANLYPFLPAAKPTEGG